MTEFNVHRCELPPKPSYSLPKLAPNSSLLTKFLREMRILCVLNPKHPQCKFLFRNTATMLAQQKRHATGPYLFIIHPFSTLSMIIDVLFCLTWSYSIIQVPLDDESHWVSSFETFFMLPLQYVLIASLFFLGYVDHTSKEIVLNHKRIILHYVKTYFVVDFLAVTLDLCDNFEIFYKYLHDEIVFTIYTILLLIFYYFRKRLLLRTFGRTLKFFKLNKFVVIIMLRLLDFFMYLHLFSCVLVFGVPISIYGSDENLPSQSWIKQAGFRYEDTLLNIYVYMESMQLTLSYFVGATRTSFYITLVCEQICVTFVSLFGRLYTLFLIADILQIFGITGISESQYERHLQQMKNYLLSKEVPQDLMNRLETYYEYKLQKHYFNETEIMDKLTEHLRTEIFLFKAKKIVQKVSGLQRLPTDALVRFMANMQSITYSPNDVICKIDSQPDGAYFISQGTVMVTNRENFELAHLEDGAEFGVLALMADKHLYTYVAVEVTEVFFLARQQFYLLLSNYPDVIKSLEKSSYEKVAIYNRVEETMKKGGTDVLSRLRKHTILETLNPRIRI